MKKITKDDLDTLIIGKMYSEDDIDPSIRYLFDNIGRFTGLEIQPMVDNSCCVIEKDEKRTHSEFF